MPHVAHGSELRSVVRSSIHPWPGNSLAIGRAVVYQTGLLTYLVKESNVGTADDL